MTDLDWDGLWNARDLGGLPGVRPGALVRSERLDQVTAAGWDALVAHGVRTVVDLRWASERERHPSLPPAPVTVVAAELEDGLQDDPEFASWIPNGVYGTPLYYRRFVARWPERCVRAVRLVAHAAPGGVLVHCAKGCDRTGLVVALLLRLVGVPVEAVADDYARTAERLAAPRARALGKEDDAERIAAVLAAEGDGGTPRAALVTALDGLDVETALRSGGLIDEDLVALRARLRA